MFKFFYKTLNSFGQAFRKKNYRLYRRFVDNKDIHKILSCIFGNHQNKVKSPEGLSLFFNPIYHGQFLSTKNLENYEPNIRTALNKLINPGMIFYDVGANIGVFSLLGAFKVGKNGKVYAFEPEEKNLRCLENTKSFNCLNNLSIVSACVAQNSGVQYFDHRGGSFSGRLVNSQDDMEKSHQITKISTVSIDNFMVQENRPPDFVKIDVEGNEWDVIKGMHLCLEQYSPILLCELHHGLNKNIKELYQFLAEKNYQCYALENWITDHKAPLNSFDNVHHFLGIKAGIP